MHFLKYQVLYVLIFERIDMSYQKAFEFWLNHLMNGHPFFVISNTILVNILRGGKFYCWTHSSLSPKPYDSICS